ncbi:uncharacterized protein LOC125498502 [Beta vulgaris subsp. vulgaris]|uniref:uncharacterized protein LOC125498502 n=1 Tax=Beta vulgaris subsp. vulgaris TaxID=3555 RepID=UPI0020370B33|nr:uncharacterized protein LOC125498502 [Beta vulgaris subsp. vulgaris]
MQIKSLNLEHTCVHVDANSKVSSQWLAKKYINNFRDDQGERLKKFIHKVFNDTEITIGYHRAWFARARAKLSIYGDASDQYKRVYDYACAILKYNLGSSALVLVTRAQNPPPTFQRMYVCMEASMAKDGNNNIFPVAWAVVEGLIDAVETVCPNTEVRFCVRHIWANFKLQFSGTTFKESFWRAARTSSRFTFIAEMEAIKFLSQDAYNYLVEIPPKYWARYAFLIRLKSNLSLNNLCETFNSAIKEARDKPIITFLEWIRRVGEWEVDYEHDTFVVNLRDRSCSCNKWDMTGIPCIHAYACTLRIRGKPEDYVDPFHSKEKYMQAYGPYIKPMPEMKQWEATEFPHPLPPPVRKMPGRPSPKKRKKEADEI